MAARHEGMIEKIRELLLAEADQKYKDFSSKINPGAENILGVRVPVLRRIAKEIVNDDWKSYLTEIEAGFDKNMPLYFEEKMLWGLAIGNSTMEPETRINYIKAFIPAIDNWAVCDICEGDLKFARKEPARTMMWEFLLPRFHSTKEFEVRFAVTMALSHYVTEEYLERVLSLLQTISHEGYYAKMAVAWAISECYVKYPARTLPLIAEYKLKDPWSHNKAIQKIRESYRVSPEEKELLNSLKYKKR